MKASASVSSPCAWKPWFTKYSVGFCSWPLRGTRWGSACAGGSSEAEEAGGVGSSERCAGFCSSPAESRKSWLTCPRPRPLRSDVGQDKVLGRGPSPTQGVRHVRQSLMWVTHASEFAAIQQGRVAKIAGTKSQCVAGIGS
eukprot:scaffold131_cov381-Pinguiococcus_pyrenoidosus.AAC.2